MQQMQKQLLAAQFKIDIAKRELTVHNKNVQQNEEVMNFFKNKFTNLGLYQYLSNNLTRLYRDAYNLAFDMALQAEQGYQFETDDDNFYISTDNWQYDRAGLLAGERLTLQLHSLEKAYIENNKRTYEINQSVSLALLNPQALLQLKESGACTFIIPEIAYDIAYPGQFKRIIKSVRVTIPCIAGPYINISAKLTLTDSWVRTKEKLNTNPLKLSENSEDELKMVKNISISTSSAQNDGGLFDLNFRDERYLPFEGAGAVSSWKLELPATLRSFNYDTISDVIFHISYTANDDAVFRTTVENNIMASLSTYAAANGLMRIFSTRHEFPNEWYQFLHPATTTDDQVLSLNFSTDRFPFFVQNKNIKITSLELAADSSLSSINGLTLLPAPTPNSPQNLTLDNKFGALLHVSMNYTTSNGIPNIWKIINPVANPRITPDQINDAFVILHYMIS